MIQPCRRLLLMFIFLANNFGLFFSEPNACMHLRDGYRFETALNVAYSPRSFSDSYDRMPTPQYRHYLLARYRLLRYQWSNEDSQMEVFPETLTNKSHQLAGLLDLSYDLVFSLFSYRQYRSYACLLLFASNQVNCYEIDHQSNSPPPAANTTTTTTAQRTDPRVFEFQLPSTFRPSVVFQYADFYNQNLYDAKMVGLLEQRLVNDTGVNGTGDVRFERNFHFYRFDLDDQSVENITQSAVPPEWLEHIPAAIEVTGIFSWTNGARVEYSVLAFNGTNHLYCLNSKCSHLEGYHLISSFSMCHPNDIDWPLNVTSSGVFPRLHFAPLSATMAKGHRFREITKAVLWFAAVTLAMVITILIAFVCYYSVIEAVQLADEMNKDPEKGNNMVAMLRTHGQDSTDAQPPVVNNHKREEIPLMHIQPRSSSNENNTNDEMVEIVDTPNTNRANGAVPEPKPVSPPGERRPKARLSVAR